MGTGVAILSVLLFPATCSDKLWSGGLCELYPEFDKLINSSGGSGIDSFVLKIQKQWNIRELDLQVYENDNCI